MSDKKAAKGVLSVEPFACQLWILDEKFLYVPEDCWTFFLDNCMGEASSGCGYLQFNRDELKWRCPVDETNPGWRKIDKVPEYGYDITTMVELSNANGHTQDPIYVHHTNEWLDGIEEEAYFFENVWDSKSNLSVANQYLAYK